MILVFLVSCTNTKTKESDHSTVGDSVIESTTSPLAASKEETEEEETERISKERFEEDQKAFSELGSYDGKYTLLTESDGATGTLELKYSGERLFAFTLSLNVAEQCDGIVEAELVMDRTQHGFYQGGSCYLHFNFMGSYADGTIVEIEQPDKCEEMKGDCIFSGTYQKIPL